jgi:hypothetical protein
MKISPTEQKAYEMIIPPAPQEAEIALNGLAAVVEQNEPAGWVMREVNEAAPPASDGDWPVRAG